MPEQNNFARRTLGFCLSGQKYNLEYIAAYNAIDRIRTFAAKYFFSNRTNKKAKDTYIFYEDLTAPRLAQTIAKETGAGLLKTQQWPRYKQG